MTKNEYRNIMRRLEDDEYDDPKYGVMYLAKTVKLVLKEYMSKKLKSNSKTFANHLNILAGRNKNGK
jgi:hypothetical protein